MDTIKLFLQTKLDVNTLASKKTKWTKYINKHGVFYKCTYSGVRLVYYYNKFALTLETSATKFLYRDNSIDFNLNDLDKLFRELDFIVRLTTGQKIISVKEWIITRLDLANNYYCNNETDKMVYLNMLNELSFSHCKNIRNYETSVHANNKSITYNIYSKSSENKHCDDRILRIEFQYKNRSLNRFKSTGDISSKKFKNVIGNISSLNNIYKRNLDKLGLDKKFLTKRKLEFVLKKLYRNTLITEQLFKNMYNYFINKTKTVSNTTLNSYKNILAKYNYSNLLLDTKPSKDINFSRFNLFDQTRPNVKKINILPLLFLLLFIEEKIIFTPITLVIYIINIFNIPAFFNDG